MKRILFVSAALAALLFQGVSLWAQQNMRTIEISTTFTTHVLFTSDLTYVDISSPDNIAAKVVDASKNMLAIKARQEFAFTTTISALEANGTMHTFYVRYNSTPANLVIDTRVDEQKGLATVNTQVRPEQPAPAQQPSYQNQNVRPSSGRTSGQSSSYGSSSSYGAEDYTTPPPAQKKMSRKEAKAQAKANKRNNVSRQSSRSLPTQTTGVNVTSSQTSNFGRGNAPTLEEVMRKDRSLYHIADKSYGLEVDCINIYAYSDFTYIVISLKNRSDIGYEAGDAQFTVESKKISSRTLTTDKSIWPKSSYGTLSCAPNSVTKIGYTIPKLTLQKNEILKIYIYEKGGNRNLFLVLDDKDVNYAVSPI